MALIRWEPAAELNSLQTEMNRLFNSLFDSPTRPSSGPSARRWAPPMDLVESGDHYVLTADLPGVAERDINIELEAGVLRISGQRSTAHTEEKGGYRRIERSHGSFSRSLTLPDGINAEAIEASFDNGVLEVRIPKPEQAKPHKVTVSVGAASNDPVITAGTTEPSEAASTKAAATEAATTAAA